MNLVLVLLALPWVAQEPETLSAGQRVRITAAQYHHQSAPGRVVVATRDTLIIQFDKPRTVHYRQVTTPDTLSVAGIERLEVSRAGGHRTGRGALIGVGIGATLGFILGWSDYGDCSDCFTIFNSAEEEGLFGGAVFGAIGAGIGALVGSGVRWDDWEEIPRARGGMLLRPIPQGGIGIGLTLRF